MSLMSLNIIETNLYKLSIDIRDLENELETTKGFIQELTTSMSRQNIRLCQLQSRIEEKRNMIQTLSNVREDRREKLRHENRLKSKIHYIDQCRQYLSEHSQHTYSLEEMTFDELIEYAHKLHLIHCMDQWICDRQIQRHQIDFPSSELEFETYEVRNTIDNDKIRISQQSSLIGYIIPLKVWYDLFGMENTYGYNLFSDASFIEILMKDMTLMK